MPRIPPINPNQGYVSDRAMAQGADAAPSARGARTLPHAPSQQWRSGPEPAGAPYANADHLRGTMDSARARALANTAPVDYAGARSHNTSGGVWTQGGVPVTLDTVNEQLEEDRARYFHLADDPGKAGGVDQVYGELISKNAVREPKIFIPPRLEGRLSRRTFAPERNEILSNAEARKIRKVQIPETGEWIRKNTLDKRKSDQAKRFGKHGQSEE